MTRNRSRSRDAEDVSAWLLSQEREAGLAIHVTSERCHFTARGAQARVDLRDRSCLLGIAKLRQVGAMTRN